jgi:hypothetical protein
MNQFQIEEVDNDVVEDMHYHPYPNNNILRCQNPVLIIYTLTGSHKSMVGGDYYPDEDKEYQKMMRMLLVYYEILLLNISIY